jgi:hypothetical protein
MSDKRTTKQFSYKPRLVCTFKHMFYKTKTFSVFWESSQHYPHIIKSVHLIKLSELENKFLQYGSEHGNKKTKTKLGISSLPTKSTK